MTAAWIEKRAQKWQRHNRHLPKWPDNLRAVPNYFLRCALFAAIQGKTRRALKRELIASLRNVEIRFTGWQLDQADLDVWMIVIHFYRGQGIGTQVEFTANQILNALGRSSGKAQHEWLKAVFSRLYSAGIEIKDGSHSFFGSLLKGSRNELSHKYIVEIDPGISNMFAAGWTQIEWKDRQRLRRKPLALWLHCWLASHAKPYPLNIKTIHRLCGSSNNEIASFKQLLTEALDALRSMGIIVSWHIEGDLVSIIKLPSKSQIRHLARKLS